MERRRVGRTPTKADRRHPLRHTARLGTAASDAHDDERERLTVKVPRDLIEQLRNAVYWTPGLTITGFLENCISGGVARLESERGQKFPTRERALRPGRPAKVR
jgi:hypothetical protein